LNLFIATLKTQTRYTESEAFQQAKNIHADYYKALIPQGKFLMSGPALTEAGEFDGGIFVFRVESREVAKGIMAHDPLVQAGFSNYSLMEFNPILKHPALEAIFRIG